MNHLERKGELFSTDLLRTIRDSFYYVEESPHAGKRIFLDSASGSLRLKPMVDVVSEELSSYAQFKRIDPASKHAEALVEECIAHLHLFIGTEKGTFFFGPSSTFTMFYMADVIMSNAPEGSNVVTTNLDHPAIYESTWSFANKYNLERRVVGFNKEKGCLETERVLEKIDSKTSLLGIIHASNITGAINHLEEIILEARKVNPSLFVLVDGVQYAPHGSMDLKRIHADAYVFGGYKIFCKKGIAFAHLSDRMARLPHWKFRDVPEDNWVLGTLDEATLTGFSTVIEYIASLGKNFTSSTDIRQQIVKGMERVHLHSRALLELILFGDESIPGLFNMDHVEIYGIDRDALGERTSLVSFRLKGLGGLEASQKYYEQGISLSPRLSNVYSKHILEVLGTTDVVRVSMCHYNTPAEIREFLKITESFA